ncbi:S9 family peptidase [Brumimicrobium oceani]|uniref:S9 family peptidase n=1 Tax=Brumimicrobium oceani TaxID=2100725 RepID=A0A2U2XET5_9FLAO|nr:S9 family peptidase [Brumimicrobium oceani]PWH86304.1 S9 family peptidase [Brumimicrobium oceani]
MKKLVLPFLILAFTAFLGAAQESDTSKALSVEHIWKEYKFYGNGISGFRSMKDGKHYSRFALVDGKKSIMRYSFEDLTGTAESILDGKELVYEGKELKVDGYEFNDDETKLLLTVNRKKRYRRSFSAEYYMYDLTSKTLSPLDSERIPQTLASYSPDGKKVAYIYRNNIYVKTIATGKVKAITNDGKENEIINGTTDWVYEEEFAYTKAYDWSPNSEYIAYLRFDESDVKEFTMMYFEELYPTPYTFKYPKTGEDNSKVCLKVAKVKNAKSTTIELGDYEYIPRLKFSSTENKLMALTLNRHQNHLKYHWIDVTAKKMPADVIYQEQDEAYVEIDDNLYFLKDGKHFIRTSEKDGYNHIYKIGIDGSSQQISEGKWDVIEFMGINEEKGILYYTSAEEGPQFTALYSIGLDGTKKDKISDNKGTNSITFSQGMQYYVNRWSNINTPPVYSLHDATGKLIMELESNEILKYLMNDFNFQQKEFITVEGATHDLNAWILYPPNFDSTKQYPVYFNVYGGPGSNMVKDAYDGGNGAYHQLLAQKGYIVMSVDPRGTMYRGAQFKKSTYLQLGKLETEDMIAVAKYIKKWDFVDPDRIGIMGWSYGGYMASLAITKGAADFKMGIAVAPVTNWRYYDNIYTERFMRTPQENALGYDDNSPINHVDKLKGNYFIIHGSGDDNVHVQNAMEMVTALVKADKDFDQFIYPNKDHGIYGGNTRNHLFRMMLEYTLENL